MFNQTWASYQIRKIACTTRNFTYLIRVPLKRTVYKMRCIRDIATDCGAFSDCGDGFRLYEFGCYKIFWVSRSWNDAKIACEQTYGALVALESQEESEALESFLATSINGDSGSILQRCDFCLSRRFLIRLWRIRYSLYFGHYTTCVNFCGKTFHFNGNSIAAYDISEKHVTLQFYF